ncbi:zinc finger MYND domain-containing protein 19 [Exaiptasia diaphana]|uniref:MYND-type domain-containing protein n=1 Tax=Exaiptasia diaphana TaxID=2652724 RepID=A0A913Y0D0_EXADI|nr:zinc finger MYND domain-containing protein 19 [Exaiptasia diaphana]KXJ23612.1 Zinc finger MYND domain-containing protein 19 [Exaiptasia diaphana]
MEPGLKLGIVYIGKAGGKHKYSLVDEKDIPIVKKFRFEARVDVDRDGNGANIYAYAYDMNKERTRGCYFHEYIWERHCGGVAPGFKVIHKNGVTVDNRLYNLTIVPNNCKKYKRQRTEKMDCYGEPSEDQSIYWTAVSRIPPPEPHEEELSCTSYSKFYDANGNLVREEDDSSSFYECHFAPCSKIEHELQEFSICGRCQQVRYCGTLCQQRDWPNHKKCCKEKAKQRLQSIPPER